MNLLNKIKKGVIHVGGNSGQASKSYGNFSVSNTQRDNIYRNDKPQT